VKGAVTAFVRPGDDGGRDHRRPVAQSCWGGGAGSEVMKAASPAPMVGGMITAPTDVHVGFAGRVTG